MCTGPSYNQCSSCKKTEVSRLSADNACPDCLSNPEGDRETCWYSVPMQLMKPSARSVNLRASTTVRLSFAEESTFYDRLDEKLLREKLNITIKGLDKSEYLSKVRFARGEIVIDLYFKESRDSPAKMMAVPID